MESNNMPDLNGVAKKTKGRQKIEMKKMRNESNLRVTFSKRRTGVFKKASELATLCGSGCRWPTSPPYLGPQQGSLHCGLKLSSTHTSTACSNQIAIEKKRTKDLNHLAKAAEDQFWWARPVESMTDSQLDKYKKMLEEFKRQLKEKRGNLN
ncbi:Agamous-like MADS-box protein AGL62 [Glycine max]|nr:Agamous-like MADS-box protein AGL62 [Glycine max]